jgi:GDP-4-dehydro-6-deoxy-D-mannose reductase
MRDRRQDGIVRAPRQAIVRSTWRAILRADNASRCSLALRLRTLLVTGHTGFVGRTVSDVVQREPTGWRIATLPDGFDIRSTELARHVAGTPADAVLHLAALTSVAASFRDPETYFDVNFNGTWNLLKALRSASFTGRLLFVSSGDCYGAVPSDELPIRESAPLRPRSPYAVSKVAAESLCYQWAYSGQLDIVLARAFNHIGPGQDSRFAVASFARQISRVRAGIAESRIVTGDLDVTRDLTDVRDVVRAYLALIDSGRTGEVYNVGSGREIRMADVLRELLSLAGVTAETIVDKSRVRIGEQRRAVADVRRIRSDAGWTPSIPLSRTLADMLDEWTQRSRLE